MQKANKITYILMLVLMLPCLILFSACSTNSASTSSTYITNIEKTGTVGQEDCYTIYYSNGSTSTFSVTNGSDGEDLNILDIYSAYLSQSGTTETETSFSEFLKLYLTITTSTDNSTVISSCLLSSLKIYAEFTESTTYGFGYMTSTAKSVAISCGSGVIYQMDDDYSYIVTNYHVIYDESANSDNGGNIARKIVGYLYGSEGSPSKTSETQNGYAVYNYGNYAIEFDYIGGSASYDIAVLKTKTENITNINSLAQAVTLASDYHVGETAISIGNTENEGISVTEGIVSVANEYVKLSVDGTTRYHRLMRIDTAIYSGNSGGGLFNKYGQLIGITNAGDSTDQNVNYAVPLEVISGVANNIISSNSTVVKSATLGISVSTSNSKYVYNTETKVGEIEEIVKVTSVSENSIAETLGIVEGDQILQIIIDDTVFEINQDFDISDALLNSRVGSTLSVVISRDSETITTDSYTIAQSDLSEVE